MGIVWAVCRFFVQRATVTVQNNEHDDTEHQPSYEKLDRDKQTVDSRLLLLQIVVGRIWPFNPTRRFCVLPHGHRRINVQWKRDCGAFGPLGRM
jgi:hypothetical protein